MGDCRCPDGAYTFGHQPDCGSGARERAERIIHRATGLDVEGSAEWAALLAEDSVERPLTVRLVDVLAVAIEETDAEERQARVLADEDRTPAAVVAAGDRRLVASQARRKAVAALDGEVG